MLTNLTAKFLSTKTNKLVTDNWKIKYCTVHNVRLLV